MNLIELLGKFKNLVKRPKKHTVIPNLNNAQIQIWRHLQSSQDLVKESSSLFYDYFFQNQRDFI